MRRASPARRSLLAALVLIVLTHVAAPGQSELVIFKEGTDLYHRPGCPSVRSGEGVLAITREQAESRGYKPHADCDPAKQKAVADAPGVARPAAPPPATVYLDGTKYYHRKHCKRLAAVKSPRAESLEVAGKSHWPCPDCRPPVRKKSAEPAVPGTDRRVR